MSDRPDPVDISSNDNEFARQARYWIAQWMGQDEMRRDALDQAEGHRLAADYAAHNLHDLMYGHSRMYGRGIRVEGVVIRFDPVFRIERE